MIDKSGSNGGHRGRYDGSDLAGATDEATAVVSFLSAIGRLSGMPERGCR